MAKTAKPCQDDAYHLMYIGHIDHAFAEMSCLVGISMVSGGCGGFAQKQTSGSYPGRHHSAMQRKVSVKCCN